MDALFEDTVLAQHFQIALVDTSAGSYPQWENGEEAFATSGRGIAIGTSSDGLVVVQVLASHGVDEDPVGWDPIYEGDIEIVEGLLVGNIETATTDRVDLLPGRYRARVLRMVRDGTEVVRFVLRQLT